MWGRFNGSGIAGFLGAWIGFTHPVAGLVMGAPLAAMAGVGEVMARGEEKDKEFEQELKMKTWNEDLALDQEKIEFEKELAALDKKIAAINLDEEGEWLAFLDFVEEMKEIKPMKCDVDFSEVENALCESASDENIVEYLKLKFMCAA